MEGFGGTVDSVVVGGVLLAVFGAPTAHEDDPERAVRAGLQVLEWSSDEGNELEPRAGVATGEALVTLDPGPEKLGLARSEVVAVALELQRVAEPGTVVVDDAGQLYALRLQIQLTALPDERNELDTLIAEARTLASRAGAPTRAWTADWAEAVAHLPPRATASGP